MSDSPVIGIDLGTTNSCVAVFIDNVVEIIQNDQGNRTTPSYVAFTESGENLVGNAAYNLVTQNCINTVYGKINSHSFFYSLERLLFDRCEENDWTKIHGPVSAKRH